jgi:hypothetical protein
VVTLDVLGDPGKVLGLVHPSRRSIWRDTSTARRILSVSSNVRVEFSIPLELNTVSASQLGLVKESEQIRVRGSLMWQQLTSGRRRSEQGRLRRSE